MIHSIITIMKNVMRKGIKKPIKKMLVLLEDACLLSPKKSVLSVWHSNNIIEKSASTDDAISGLQPTYESLNWKSKSKVKFSGVCVLLHGKLLMCRPVEKDKRNLDSRKAIVCTKNYRPMKYPGAQPFLSLTFMRRNLAYWMNEENHTSLPCNAALLGNSEYDNDNYYHFWVDVIADIWYLRQHLTEEELPDYYLIQLANLTWQWDALKLCGISESQVISYASNDVLSFDKLTVPIRDKGAVNLPPWLCRAMHDMCGWSPTPQKGERLIFVSRADADRRRIANEAAIRDRLHDEGFEIHTLNGLSVTDQQRLFASAAIICAPHGAALTNLVWCGPGTVVIELLSAQHLNPCFRDLAMQSHLFYYPFACKQVGDVTDGLRGDIIVSFSQIESVLDIVARHAQRAKNNMAG